MSKMTTLVGPPRERGILERMRASVKAVATSPSASTCIREVTCASSLRLSDRLLLDGTYAAALGYELPF